MLRKMSEAVPESNGPVPQKAEFRSDQPTWGEVYRMMKEIFHRWDRQLDVILDEKRTMVQRVARLEQVLDAQQSRLTMEADGKASTKTRERTKGCGTTVQAMHGDSCTAQ